MEDFKLNLQLFAEGEVAGEVVQPDSQDTANGSQEPSEGNIDFEFAIDQDGNVVFVDDDEQQEGTPDGQQPAQQQSAAEQPDKQFYSPEEMRNLDFEQIDTSRIPPEMVPVYKALQASYTRNNQQVVEMRKQLEQQAMRQQVPQPQVPQQQVSQEPPNPKAYYEQLLTVAKGNVENTIGEKYDEFNPLHQAAIADEVANIKIAIEKQQMFQNNLRNVMNTHMADPEWNSIDAHALKMLNDMPYQQAVQVKSRIDNGDVQFIDNYLRYVRNNYYQAKNGNTQQQPNPVIPQIQQKAKPPYTEAASAAPPQPQTETRKFNVKDLGRMNMAQQAALFEKAGLTDI